MNSEEDVIKKTNIDRLLQLSKQYENLVMWMPRNVVHYWMLQLKEAVPLEQVLGYYAVSNGCRIYPKTSDVLGMGDFAIVTMFEYSSNDDFTRFQRRNKDIEMHFLRNYDTEERHKED